VFLTTIVERAAFRDLFDYGGGLADLDPGSVSNLAKARENARAFAGEVVAKLRAAATGQGRAALA
ncbi:MAG TPA: ParA family protein, partial [Paracoccaceae bacterium]|nr:ParA family protein [Paracoccaceae bacterium]